MLQILVNLWKKVKEPVMALLMPWKYIKKFKDYPGYQLEWALWFIAIVFILLGAVTSITALAYKYHSWLQWWLTSGFDFLCGISAAIWYIVKYYNWKNRKIEKETKATKVIKKAACCTRTEV